MSVTENRLAEAVVGLRGELRSEIARLGAELRAEIAELRAELHAEIAGLRAEMERRFTEQTWQIVLWVTAVMAVMVGAATSILIAVLG